MQKATQIHPKTDPDRKTRFPENRCFSLVKPMFFEVLSTEKLGEIIENHDHG